MTRLMSTSVFARVLILCISVSLIGCGKGKPEPKENGSKPGVAKNGQNPKAGAQTPDKDKPRRPKVVDPPPPVAQVPPVVMSKQHRDEHTIFQNDQIPADILDAELIGLDGKTHSIRSSMGDKLTIVLFWSSDHAYSVEELKYLAAHYVEKYGDKGVKIVTINQRDAEKLARETAGSAGASSLVTLLDAQKSLGRLASGHVPRTYLLDSEGRVLWLDTVFDRTTQRALFGAIDFVLNKS